MLFKVNRENILSDLQNIVGVIEKKQTIPILANVLLEADHDQLTMTGTDLEIQLVTKSSIETNSTGKTTTSARKLLDFCRLLPEGAQIGFELSDNKLTLNSDRSQFRLNTLDVDSFPDITTNPPLLSLGISSEKLKYLLQATSFCMANQDVRYYLNALMLEINKNHLKAVASDGHRLATSEIEVETKADRVLQTLFPRKAIQELLRLLGNENFMVLMNIAESTAELNFKNSCFKSKLVDGKFPHFEDILKHELSAPIVLDRDEFKNALARVSVLSHEKYRDVNIIIENGSFKINTDNTDHEQADEEIGIEYNGKKMEICVNINYLFEAVSNLIGKQVIFSVSNQSNISYIQNKKDEHLIYVIMPMRR
ncbi:DNA polymerase III subunit beta [bacterium]|nr:DNA polymerase III subunit beta [bacterium]